MQGEENAYLDTVSNQIRWKEARTLVRKELQGHIEDKKQDAVEKGSSQLDAERKAVEAMGDPVETGRMMDKLHKPRLDIWMLASIAVLIAFGIWILMTAFDTGKILSLSGELPNQDVGGMHRFNEWFYFRMIGLALGAVCIFINFRWLLSKKLFYIIAVPLGLAYLLFINLTNNMWDSWAGISDDWLVFMEYICSITLFLSLAGWVARLEKRSIGKFLILFIGILGFVAMILTTQQYAKLLSFCFIVFAVTALWRSKIHRGWLGIAIGIIVIGIACFFLAYPIYLKILPGSRVLWSADDNATRHILGYGEIAGNIQLIGENKAFTEQIFGFPGMASMNTLFYILLKFGLLPGIVLIGAIGILLWRLIRASLRIRDMLGRILATGLAAYIVAMTLGNLILNAFLLQMDANYLPFLQSFGSEFVLVSAILGIILGLYRRKDLYPANNQLGAEKSLQTK